VTRRRVVVTGLGAVTPLANDVPGMWEALIAGRSGISRIASFDASALDVQIAAEVRGFDPDELFGRRQARRNDLFTLYAMEAARQAVAQSGLEIDDQISKVAGAIVGTGVGGMVTLLDNYDVYLESGPRRVSPFMVPMMMPNSASAKLALDHGLRGPNHSVSSACATGADAIGEAAEQIRLGKAEVMLAGGSEAGLAPVSISSFSNMGALSKRNDEPERSSRPFDAERDGFVMGQGAGILMLESLEFARARGAKALAELLGYGATADASHITAPDPEGTGAARAMELAIKDAGLAEEQVHYINAHGTSTVLNDRMETKAIRKVFGSLADKVPVSATKSMMGHLMGGAGAAEAIVCVKCLETGWVPPTINYENPDPECDLDYVPNQAREVKPHYVLSNSFGFGGHNACLVFGRWED
jgi:3-oxoacyl-[acyl-carrier-protein] synthase II